MITFAPAFRAEFRGNDGKCDRENEPVKTGRGYPGARGVKKYFQFFRNIFWNKEKSFYLCRPEREKRNRQGEGSKEKAPVDKNEEGR